MMPLVHLEAAVMFGMVIITLITGISSLTSLSSGCPAAVETCMSDLCKREPTHYMCEDRRCQIKGSEVCNMTVQAIMDQFPSLRGCVCAWEEELCGSIEELATQCHQKTGVHQERSINWQKSSLVKYVYDASGSCLDQIKVCLGDVVCNRLLVPVLETCTTAEQCDSDRCQQVTRHFYSNMPQNVAEMLILCECEASDFSCLHMKAGLHSGTCGDETWICQNVLTLCVENKNCRALLETFRSKCWSPEDGQCNDNNPDVDECFTHLNPALLHGEDSECKKAFLATLGTVLHHPCTCIGLHSQQLHTCSRIHDVFHNRQHFIPAWKSKRGPSKFLGMNEPESSHPWSADYLLYACATVLLIGVVLMPLAVFGRTWMLKRRDKTNAHCPIKRHDVL
ncbi:GDNF family receptor alpha-like [Gouania willdenowi]|uniref:GDNF family receptor alpha-like n=1 Tax=Gouania willdenowi TaxID=441366 RepID=UPI001055415D|nr:GDNF family receptor alpha-like [Gouania willdenowi]